MDNFSASAGAVRFAWDESWLTGEEYGHILNNVELYCAQFGMQRYGQRQHPLSIYQEPSNGMIYFVAGQSVGSEFGFPRVDIKKRFRWKKMNFTTDLPKRQPIVTYIVASALKCEKFFPAQLEGPIYRMHAVVLISPQPQSFVLCHVRRLSDEEPLSPLHPALRNKRRNSPSPLKRPRKEDSTQSDGLCALLEAAMREETGMACDSSDDEEMDPAQRVVTAASSDEILGLKSLALDL